MALNFLSTMLQTNQHFICNFTDGAYSQARLYPTSSNFNSVENNIKIISSIHVSADIGGVGVNIDRVYNHTSKKTDAEKIQLRSSS